jgi:hypothetical protein
MNIRILRDIENHFGKKAIKVEDRGKYYKILFSNKSTTVVFKPEEFSKTMSEIHRRKIETTSKCSLQTLTEIKELCTLNLRDIPLVTSYINRSYEIVKVLERAYGEIGKTNVLHFFIKNISPEIHGRAQTFMSEVTELQSLVEEVLLFKENEVIEKRKKLRVVRRVENDKQNK